MKELSQKLPLKFKFSKVSAGIFGMLAVFSLFLAPRQINVAKSENCNTAPSVATLNYYPVQFGNTAGYNCTDFPAIDARLAQGGQYSQTASDWHEGLTADVGDEIYVLLFIHNGARQDGDPSKTIARDVKVSTHVDGSVGREHMISATFSGANTNTVNSGFAIHTPDGSELVAIPDSGEVFDYHPNLIRGGLDIANTTFSLGDMNPCYEYSRYIRFKVKVVKKEVPPPPIISSDMELKVNANAFCVGQVPAYEIEGTKELAGKAVRWISTLNGQVVGAPENVVGYMSLRNGESYWSGSGNQFILADVGTWTKTAKVDGLVRTVTFVVSPCNTASNNLVCIANVQNVGVNQGVVFAATGGDGGYEWNTGYGYPSYGTGAYFTTAFANPGNYSVVVKSGSLVATCNVVITQINNTCVNNSCNNYTYYPPVYTPPAPVYIPPYTPPVISSVPMSLSKKAFNETKNADATTVNAARADTIVYTLTATNNNNTDATNFVITDDLSGVLAYSDVIDNGGGSLSGSTISFPGMAVPAGGSVSRSFKVQVKPILADNLRYVMTNTYGNTVTVNINNPQVLGAFTAPRTGAETNALWFASALTLGFVAFKKRAFLKALLLAK